MCAKENLKQRRIQPGSRGYTKALEAAINSISYEAFHHSLSPGEGLGENPQTPAIPAKVYAVYEDLQSLVGEGDPLILQRLHGAVSFLSQLYCDKRAGLKKSSDFSYHSASTKADMKKVEENRYFRIFIANMVMGVLEKIYEMDPDKVWELLKSGGMEGQSLAALKDSGGRVAFSRALKSSLTSGLSGLDLLGAIRKSLQG